ncbi:universal stress protein [Bacillus solitudinis]|uniref:universal stress protein n=1 Tax=Bacillus solitudinis TaxID=2014074 RepID=UPI000C233845|nr:universal stress protein [Bacillus solitudinis]
MFNGVLVAADGSSHSLRAAEKAIEIVSKKTRSVDIVYVISGTASKEDVLHNRSKYEIKESRRIKLKVIEEKFFANKINYSVHVLRGDPGPEIVEFANKGSYDCLIVGSRGLNQLQTMVLGSVSHKVAKHVECPVLIVK